MNDRKNEWEHLCYQDWCLKEGMAETLERQKLGFGLRELGYALAATTVK